MSASDVQKSSGNQAAPIHEELSLPSHQNGVTLVGDLWVPTVGKPKAVVQIVHGMVEHILRYEGFANTLCANGYAVCGVDHLGHGRTCPDASRRGVYNPETGANFMIEDQHSVRLAMQERFEGLPYFILGHSMGSFITRCYIARHGEGLAGVVVMGTAWQDPAMLAAGRIMARAIARVRGWNFRSEQLNGLGVGSYNKNFEGTGAQTGVEWLSRDEDHCKAYLADPDCGWMFSVSGYYTLFKLLREAQNTRRIAQIPASLPALFISGSEDPVGSDGIGPAKALRAFRDAGVKDTELILIEGGRHEILGEINKGEVEQEIVQWLDQREAAWQQ